MKTKRTGERWGPLLVLIGILAACGDPAVPAKATPGPAPTPTPAPKASCTDSAIRLRDREDAFVVHGAIVDDTLHMGGQTAQATCTEAANLSLLAAFSMPGGRTAQVQQSQYYLIRIHYPNGTRLYVIKRRVDGTACVVDTDDVCVATVSGLPDDFDVSDLPGDVPPRIPAGRDAPEPPVTTGTEPDVVRDPYPSNQATGVTVDAPLLSWAASPRATSYDLYWGTTKDLAADADLGTPINTSETAVPLRRPGATATDRRLADNTTYYWRVDAKNDAGVTRGNVWSFTTGAAVPNVAGIYEGNATYVRTTPAEGDVVREEVMTRNRYNIFQVTSAEVVLYYGTVLDVLPGDDSALRDQLMMSVGKPGRSGVGVICALSPDGTCRPCAGGPSDPYNCDRVIDGTEFGAITTFKGSLLSYRMELHTGGPGVAPGRMSIIGMSEKVADDPGPLAPFAPAPPSDRPPGEPGAGGPQPPAAPPPTAVGGAAAAGPSHRRARRAAAGATADSVGREDMDDRSRRRQGAAVHQLGVSAGLRVRLQYYESAPLYFDCC